MNNMNRNPWKSIPPEDYEAHMSHGSVFQLQTLNTIMKEQYEDYRPECLVVFGVCTGNGLEHIDPAITKKLYGIDVNEDYLKLCRKRYAGNLRDLRLVAIDCNSGYVENVRADLIIADLFLEYIDIGRFFAQIEKMRAENTVISVVLQRNRGESFVSNTGIESLKALDGLHRELDADEFKRAIKARGYSVIKEGVCSLPNNKEFHRIDFTRMSRPAD
jgi:hypothetical protein